jgi:hypothetical protein
MTEHKKFSLKSFFTRKKIFYCIYMLLLLVITGSLNIAARKSTAFAEWYSTHIYKFLVTTVGRLVGFLPFSLYELLIILGIALLFWIIFRIVYLIIKKRAKRILTLFAGVLALLLTVLTLFTLNCGVNYHRRPFSYYSGLTVARQSTDVLTSLCQFLIAEANALVPYIDTIEVPDDEDGTHYGSIFSLDNTDTVAEAVKAMNNLGTIYPVLNGYYPNAKPVLFSKVMSYEFITGVYSFTIEANYNNDVPDYVKADTICHELSHLRGFMREDEAGFIAYLACIHSDNVSLKYSGILNALSYVLNSVYSNCGAAVYTELYKSMDIQLMRDYLYDSRYWDKYRTPVAEVADAVNNAYLVANAQTDGVKSYGRMVDLLLAYYISQHN